MLKSTEDRINLLHPKIREEVRSLVEKANKITGNDITIAVVQGLRTVEEQNALYAQGRTKPGSIVTNAKGGQSFHNFGTAIDFAFYIKDKGIISWDVVKDWDNDGKSDWMEVVKVFKDAGYEWGGDFRSIKDMPHFQKNFGLTWQQMLDKYNKKDFIPGTKYINI